MLSTTVKAKARAKKADATAAAATADGSKPIATADTKMDEAPTASDGAHARTRTLTHAYARARARTCTMRAHVHSYAHARTLRRRGGADGGGRRCRREEEGEGGRANVGSAAEPGARAPGPGKENSTRLHVRATLGQPGPCRAHPQAKFIEWDATSRYQVGHTQGNGSIVESSLHGTFGIIDNTSNRNRNGNRGEEEWCEHPAIV